MCRYTSTPLSPSWGVTLPITFTVDQIKAAIRVYEAGVKDGKRQGRSDLQFELRQVFGVN